MNLKISVTRERKPLLSDISVPFRVKFSTVFCNPVSLSGLKVFRLLPYFIGALLISLILFYGSIVLILAVVPRSSVPLFNASSPSYLGRAEANSRLKGKKEISTNGV